MRFNYKKAAFASLAAACAFAQPAMAQSGDADALMALGKSELQGELQMRYDAGLAASTDPAIVSANDPRYLWALETKAQCGIALGYLKSSTKDPVSIGKCARAYMLMQRPPAPMAVPTPTPTPTPTPQVCENPALIFFGFDVATPPAEANQVISFIQGNYQACRWNGFTVVGHADRSGSNAYNEALSQERARNVADMLTAAVPGASVTTDFKGESEPRVPTADGVREPQNRRVEIQTR